MKQIILNLVNAAQNFPDQDAGSEISTQYREQRVAPAMDIAIKLAKVVFEIDDLRDLLKSIDSEIQSVEESIQAADHIIALMQLSKDKPMMQVIALSSTGESPEEHIAKISNNRERSIKALITLRDKRRKIAGMVELSEVEEMTR